MRGLLPLFQMMKESSRGHECLCARHKEQAFKHHNKQTMCTPVTEQNVNESNAMRLQFLPSDERHGLFVPNHSD
jgi:hypothetical protein